MLKKALTLCIFVLSASVTMAQKDSVASATRYIQSGLIEKARIAIDAAATHSTTSSDPYTWYMRGFIYKELYKKFEKQNKISESRDVAIASFIKSMSFDPKNEFINENKSNIKYLATSLYNDAAESLNEITYEISIINFEKFKDAKKIEDPSFDLNAKENEFNLALATVYENLYLEEKNKNELYFNLQVKLYQKIIKNDPENYKANYNLGMLYFNKGVNIIKELEYDVDIENLIAMQDGFVKIFKEALPYAEKAYLINSNRKESIKALMGIYFSLNDLDKYNEMKKIHDSTKEE